MLASHCRYLFPQFFNRIQLSLTAFRVLRPFNLPAAIKYQRLVGMRSGIRKCSALFLLFHLHQGDKLPFMYVQTLIDDAHPITEFSQKCRVCLLLVSLPSTDIAHLQVLALQDGLRTHWNPRDFLDRTLQEVGNGGSFHHLRWMLILHLLMSPVYLMRIERSRLDDDLGLLEWLLWNVVGVVINH